jgi:predicted DNA-binding transcriptional regulator YafY
VQININPIEAGYRATLDLPHDNAELTTSAGTAGEAVEKLIALAGRFGPALEVAREVKTLSLARRVAVDAAAIRVVLTEAEPGDVLVIEYKDRDGDLTTRKIRLGSRGIHKPYRMWPEEYITAVDLEKDEPRTFRLDRIQRLELV